MDVIKIYTVRPDDLMRMFWFALIAFVITIVWTPLLTKFLYKNKIGKRIRVSADAPIYASLHKKKDGTPTMGGLLVWMTVAALTVFFNLSRSATWLPLFALVTTGIVGAIDDLFNVRGIGEKGGGLRLSQKLPVYAVIAAVGAWWFYDKLDWNSIHIPAVGDFTIGAWYIPLFILVLIWTAFASNETDGLDGLAGGIFALAYTAYAVIALTQGRTGLAVFCATIVGSLLSFLWFNIPPARFFMGDTGSMALGMTLSVVAFLTNTIIPFFVITLVFSVEGLSFIIQYLSKKFRGKKIFISSPLHHHLEAIGWPEYKITMRFWVISAVCTFMGLALALIGKGNV